MSHRAFGMPLEPFPDGIANGDALHRVADLIQAIDQEEGVLLSQ